MTALYPLTFSLNLHEVVWGGQQLEALKGLPTDGRPIGESWEVSAVPTSKSRVAYGPLQGLSLEELAESYGADLVGRSIYERYGNTLPLLVKFIDTQGDLSIQVHPNDALAKARHGGSGKTEMWYVMAARPGATILSGFRREISKEECLRRVQDGSIVEVLARHEVRPGDVFFIPAGRVHAICSGILLCEIQQSSDITYRIFDYNRAGLDGKPRQLHTEAALEALDFHVYEDYCTHYQPVAEGAVRITDCDFFAVNLLRTAHTLHRDLRAEDSFVTLSCIEGQAVISTHGGHRVELHRGYSCLMPACECVYDVESTGGTVRILEAFARTGTPKRQESDKK